jgi:hypothetical protein
LAKDLPEGVINVLVMQAVMAQVDKQWSFSCRRSDGGAPLGIAPKYPTGRKRQGHPTRLAELPLANVKQAPVDIHIAQVQGYGFSTPEACGPKQSKKGRVRMGPKGAGGWKIAGSFKKCFDLSFGKDMRKPRSSLFYNQLLLRDMTHRVKLTKVTAKLTNHREAVTSASRLEVLGAGQVALNQVRRWPLAGEALLAQETIKILEQSDLAAIVSTSQAFKCHEVREAIR